MLTDKEKLRNFLAHNNINQTQFETITGVKQQVVSRLLNSKDEEDCSATPALKYALLKNFNYDIEADKYLQLSPQKDITTNIVPVIFYEAKASAGKGETLPEYTEKDVIYFDRRWLKNVIGVNPDNVAILLTKGHSMDSGLNKPDDIRDGDLLMIDASNKEPINNQVFVVKHDGELFVKRVVKQWDGSWHLVSQNKDFDDIIPNETTEVIGRVVWNGSRENV